MINKKLTARELVHRTIDHHMTNKVPKGEIVLDDISVSESVGCKSVGFEERFEYVKKLNLDIITLTPKYMSKGTFQIDYDDVEKWVKDTSLFVFVMLDGAFEYGLRTFGFDKYFSMVLENPRSMSSFISEVESFNLKAILQLATRGVDGIIIADDIAYQKGLMIHPKQFRDVFLPSLAKQVKSIINCKMVPFFHSDGNYLTLVEDIINVGFRGIHCIDRKCKIGLEEFQPYIDNICLWGHLDDHTINESCNRLVMQDLVQEIISITNFTGFILGTNSGLFPGIDINQLKKIHSTVDEIYVNIKKCCQ